MAQTFLRFRQWHMLCVLPLFLLLLAGCTQDVYDMPPTVLINGENSRLANVVYEKLPEGAEYLGELSNCVPPNQMPTENLKANGDLDGHQVYRLDSSSILVEHDRGWQCYGLFPESSLAPRQTQGPP